MINPFGICHCDGGWVCVVRTFVFCVLNCKLQASTQPARPCSNHSPAHMPAELSRPSQRLPLPLSARICRCRRTLDPLGGHRGACAQAGVLRGRGIPLERAAARVCREAGARVTTNTRLSDLNLDHINRHDDRRIEVIANGLPLWGGAQLAVDTTLVSPLTSSSQPRRRAGQYAGAALQDARKSKERTYPELLFQTVQARGPRPRNRGPVEPGSNHFPPPLGPNKSQSSYQHPPQSCRSFPPLTLVSHPHTCGPACIRGQSPGLRLRRHQH